MRIFVAGASGAIGQPLIAELVRRGHEVTGMTHSEAGARNLADMGAAVARVSAFDAAAVEQALRDARAEVVIDELTSLPKDPSEMAASAPGDRRLRIEGGGNLHRAARANGVRRYIQQASGFFLEPGSGLADETAGMAIGASPGVAASARTYAELEARVLNAGDMEGVALRYGFFYGPGTWYHPDGASADQVRRQEVSVIGNGEGVWSGVPIEDAAIATVEALTAPPGVYHVVDDDPSPVAAWLPAFDSAAPQPRLGSPWKRHGRQPGRTPCITGRSSAAHRMRRRRGRSASGLVAWNGWTGKFYVEQSPGPANSTPYDMGSARRLRRFGNTPNPLQH